MLLLLVKKIQQSQDGDVNEYTNENGFFSCLNTIHDVIYNGFFLLRSLDRLSFYVKQIVP